MSRMPPRDAASSLLLLLLLALAVLLAPDAPGPGPLALCSATAAVHAALVAPSLGAGSLWPVLLCLPALAATGYGHGRGAVALSLVLVALAAAAGTAARRARTALYLPSMILVFAAPFALHYLTVEFGSVAHAEWWRRLSPITAAHVVAAGGALPAPCVLLLLAWPVRVLAARGRA